MRKILLIVTVVLLTVGATAGWLILKDQPASAPESQTTQSVKENDLAPDPKEHNFTDIDFAKKMIVHSQQGIQMTDIAQRNAENEEVRQLAASIGNALSISTQQYINWLTEWNEEYLNLSYFPEMEGHDMYPTHPGMARLADLRSLETATGRLVDELFLRLMIAHHEGVVEIAGIASERMQFGKLIDLKDETLKNQAEEIQKMKQLQITRE